MKSILSSPCRSSSSILGLTLKSFLPTLPELVRTCSKRHQIHQLLIKKCDEEKYSEVDHNAKDSMIQKQHHHSITINDTDSEQKDMIYLMLYKQSGIKNIKYY